MQFPDSIGISVHLLSTAKKDSFDPWAQTIVIRVDTEHRYYLNTKQVSIKRLPEMLRHSFSARANWTAYVEGDSDASYGDVIQAVDAVRTAHGKVVLLTTSSR